MKQKITYLLLLSLLLNGCAMFGDSPSSTKKRTTSKSSVPKVPSIAKPGGDNGSWRYIGTTDDGQLIDEINDSSIKANTSKENFQVYNFQDRKTVVTPKQFTYPSGQAPFKYLISTWQMNCSTQEYLLNSATQYNESGALIVKNDYTDNSSIKWLKFTSGSFAGMQYNYICLNKNRNLGY